MVSPIQDCNGTGCCTIGFGAEINAYSSTIEFKFVRRAETNLESHHNRSLSWDTIYITDTAARVSVGRSLINQTAQVPVKTRRAMLVLATRAFAGTHQSMAITASVVMAT